MDESESMRPAIEHIKAGVDSMVQQLMDEGIDFQLGVVGFGADDRHARTSFDGQPHIHTPFTTQVQTFKSALDQLTDEGGVEPGFSAVTLAMSNAMGFRPGAAVCAILVSNEDVDIPPRAPETKDDAVAALRKRNAVFMGIVDLAYGTTRDDYGPNEGSLAQVSGGLVFDIAQFLTNPQPILTTIIATCTQEVAVRDPAPPATDLAPGFYFTDINIHNPNDRIVTFMKKIALDGEGPQQHGLQTSPVPVILGPEEALHINCTDIIRLLHESGMPLLASTSLSDKISAQQRIGLRGGLGGGAGSQYVVKFTCGQVGGSVIPFLKGFIVLYSRVKLDVAASYTACPSTCNTAGGITTIQVDELIQPSPVPPPAVFLKSLSVSSSEVSLSITPFSSLAFDAVQLLVYDLRGRLLYDSGFRRGTRLSWRPLISGSNLANGVYLYVIVVRDVLDQVSYQMGKFAWLR